MKKTTNEDIAIIEPKLVWSNFTKLLNTPRPSFHEEAIQTLMLLFGKSLGLESYSDEVNNIIIKKPGQCGLEDKAPIILQGHLDIVAQKNEGTDHDFPTDPIDAFIDGDWVTARGTTLGADNGIGCAFAMALLESKDIAHPPLECVFTACEEAGMFGAIGLKGDHFQGRTMLNLDTEEEDEIIIGCAGGIDLSISNRFDFITSKNKVYKVSIKGGRGGHSGIDIHKERVNTIKLIPEVLEGITDFQIASIQGGSLRNAIARESFFEVALSEEHISQIRSNFEVLWQKYSDKEPNLNFSIEDSKAKEVISLKDSSTVIDSIKSNFHGVKSWDKDFKGVVETSNNLGLVRLNSDGFEMCNLVRSSNEDARDLLANEMKTTQEDLGHSCVLDGAYPGWKPNAASKALAIASSAFEELRGEKPRISSIHAGLECGILSKAMPEVDIISFGPTITGAHSPDEQVSISSVSKTWDLFLEIIKRL